ncbi:MAG: SurA N-terminal domain-containing protein [bacterium]
MLTQIRERASGWLAWVIVTLITIPFALWGIQSYFENTAEGPVATVNGDDIALYQYQNELSRRRQALRQSGANAARLESQALRDETIEAMVAGRTLEQYVRARNYRLSDDELRRRIESTPEFITDGAFDPALYRDLLRANGYSPQYFESTQRQSAGIEQLSASLTDSAFATEAEINHILALQAQTREADYAIVPASAFAAEIEITEADAEQDYQANLSDHQSPARVRVDYIELSVDRLAKAFEPSDAELDEVYQQSIARYAQAETRKASHILFALDQSADEATDAEVLAQAEAVLAEARGGADFAELAKQHSADPGSKGKGGDLGVVARGQMVKPFEDAVFEMNADEIRGPIKTRFGYHLIKLTELQAARQKPLDEVRDEVAEEAKRIQGERLFAELGESFENLVFESPDSLDAAADELGLEVQRSDWFTNSAGEGVADNADVRRAAFSEDVLVDNLNSTAIELGFDRLVAMRKAEHEEARTKPFADVRADIETRLKASRAAQAARELGERLLAELRDGGDWQAVLQSAEIESTALPARRAEVSPEFAEIGDAVFARAHPNDGETAHDGLALANGDYALYALKAVVAGKPEDIAAPERAQLRAQLLARDGGGAYQQLRDTIRQNAAVIIDHEQMESRLDVY